MTPAETGYLTLLIDFALTEDLSDDGDVTSRATIPAGARGEAAFVAREPGVLAGIEAAERVCKRVDHQLEFAAVRRHNSGPIRWCVVSAVLIRSGPR